jgi:hypothetical protein
MISCFDPATRAILNAATRIGSSILGGFTGITIDISEIFILTMGLGARFDLDAPTINMTVLSIDINGNRAIANVILSAGGQEANTIIPMMKSNMGWYINGFGIFD